jgi:hypothetical protein
MMFIVRTRGAQPEDADIQVKVVRKTPAIVPNGDGQIDLFCVAEEQAPERLRAQGWNVVPLRDGWYEDDDRGGVAIWGQGKFWEVRSTTFVVKEAVGPQPQAVDGNGKSDAGVLNVRKAILGGV